MTIGVLMMFCDRVWSFSFGSLTLAKQIVDKTSITAVIVKILMRDIFSASYSIYFASDYSAFIRRRPIGRYVRVNPAVFQS
jgi:hypothetical protein